VYIWYYLHTAGNRRRGMGKGSHERENTLRPPHLWNHGCALGWRVQR